MNPCTAIRPGRRIVSEGNSRLQPQSLHRTDSVRCLSQGDAHNASFRQWDSTHPIPPILTENGLAPKPVWGMSIPISFMVWAPLLSGPLPVADRHLAISALADTRVIRHCLAAFIQRKFPSLNLERKS